MRRLTLILSALAFAVPLARAEDQQEKAGKLAAVLKSEADPHAKAEACRELGVYGVKDSVPALAALLGDEKLSTHARTALENIPDPAVDEAFRDALGKLKGKPLMGVIASIGARHDAKAVESLAALLSDADADVAGFAAASLGKIATPDAAAALGKALPNAPAAVLPAVCEGDMACAEAALAQGKRDDAIALYERLRAVQAPDHIRIAILRGAIVARGTAGIPLLLEQLKSSDAGVFAALRAAHELAGPEVTKALADEVAKLPPGKQVPVIQTLGNRGDVAAVPAVMAIAKSGTGAPRLAAIHVLAQLGDASALTLLVELLSSADAEIARTAKMAVASFAGNEVDAAIATLLNQPDAKARLIAVDLINERRVAGALPALLKAAEDADEQVRAASLKALGNLAGANDLPALLGLLAKAKSPQEATAAETALTAVCARQPDREACAEKIVAGLAAAQGAQKAALLRALRSVGGVKALAAVRAATADADAEVKDAALRVLCEWPTADALPDLTQLAKTATDAKLKILALRGLYRLVPKQDAPAEKKLAALKDALALTERSEEKRLALAALAEIPHADAVAMIEQSLTDAAVKAEAENALLKAAQALAASDPDCAKAALAKLAASTANAELKKQADKLLRQLDKGGVAATIAWQVVGPYTQEGKDGFALRDVVFPPEKPDAKDVKWVLLPPGVERDGAPFFDLAAACGAGENKCAYVRTWIRSGKEQPARFEFGADDCDKVWLNGTQIHSDSKGGAATPTKFGVAVTLKQGANALLMKVTQVSGPWEFCFRICKPDGSGLDGLKTQATPPAE